MNQDPIGEEIVFELLANKYSRRILSRHVKTIINLSGNEEKYYRCAISEATVHINNGIISLDFKKEDQSDKIIRLWKGLLMRMKI